MQHPDAVSRHREALSTRAPTPKMSEPHAVRVVAADGAVAEILLVSPPFEAREPRRVLYWLPAMGVPAKHYLALARTLVAQDVAVALHEWRGIGSSDRRASGQQN